MTKQVVLITGASSGMGKAAAKQFYQAGYEVFAGARRVEKMQDLADMGINVQKLDVTLPDSNQVFVDAALEKFGRIDVLINNAGYGSFGALEDVSPEEARRQFDVNVFGAMNLTQLVLPTMRAQHAGKILNNSSIGGQLYSPLGGWYYASKHALEALSDSLRLEVSDFGIDVIVIEPGGTDTNWLPITMEHMQAATKPDSAYRGLVDQMANLNLPATGESADELGHLMLRVADIVHPKTRYQARLTDKLVVVLARKLSYRAFDKLVNFSLRLAARQPSNTQPNATSNH